MTKIIFLDIDGVLNSNFGNDLKPLRKEAEKLVGLFAVEGLTIAGLIFEDIVQAEKILATYKV